MWTHSYAFKAGTIPSAHLEELCLDLNLWSQVLFPTPFLYASPCPPSLSYHANIFLNSHVWLLPSRMTFFKKKMVIPSLSNFLISTLYKPFSGTIKPNICFAKLPCEAFCLLSHAFFESVFFWWVFPVQSVFQYSYFLRSFSWNSPLSFSTFFFFFFTPENILQKLYDK